MSDAAANRERDSARTTCPLCGSNDVVPIEYGMPGPEMWKDVEAGKIELGGCGIVPDNPTQKCRACGHTWGRLDESEFWDEA